MQSPAEPEAAGDLEPAAVQEGEPVVVKEGELAVDPHCHGARYSKNAKSTVALNPRNHSFYPPLCTKLLNAAKARMRLSCICTMSNCFPAIEIAIENQCTEVLLDTIAFWQNKKLLVERGYFPEYQVSMIYVLWNDLQNLRSEIKKCALHIITSAVNLQEQWLHSIKAKVTDLLQNSKILAGDWDEQGKVSNFAHPTIKHICLAMYYSNSVKSLCQFKEFLQSVPPSAVLLSILCSRCTFIIYSIITMFQTHGSNVKENLNVEWLKVTYLKLQSWMDAVAAHQHHSLKLIAMLQEWASIRM
ncbi:hypothetical protein EV363DRAFT_1158667 [Boletus edulis]|nr:hypothetical protein EV363DRAFT_1158667 [Boletus edulis]